MPYIKQDRRKLYQESVGSILDKLHHFSATDAAGDFTYIVYSLLKRFGGSFWMRALGIGCLICAILEIYRKDHAPYEDMKEFSNGSVPERVYEPNKIHEV